MHLRHHVFRGTLAALLLVLAGTTFSNAAPVGYWPVTESSGSTTVVNTVGGGTNASLLNGATVVTDGTRGQVMSFDGNDDYGAAGTAPALNVGDNFTWSFWAKQDALQPINNDVIIGNRKPDSGWQKFTPSGFEYRDIAPTFNNGIDYADVAAADGWVNYAVVKSGSNMTYYRNGISLGQSTATGTMPARPFNIGGDATDPEKWQGLIDDVAIWTDALPRSSIAKLASGAKNPGNVSITPNVSQTVFSDNFNAGTVDTVKWTVADKGLEQVGPAGYNAPNTTSAPGALTLGGTTNNQYWFGSSLISNTAFDITKEMTVSVNRVSISGSGSAFRSSLWLYSDATHYVHFSQNVNEGGWSYNVSDVGGVAGTGSATGSGINIASLDGLDGDLGSHLMSLSWVPNGQTNGGIVEIYLDGNPVGGVTVSNWTNALSVILTGQGRAATDTVSAVFDNLTVTQVPEPGSIVLGGGALVALAAFGWRRKR